jgi:hypothetical protein
VTAFRDYLVTLMKVVAESRSKGNSGEALANAALPELTMKYGQWGNFKGFAPRNIRDAEGELAGTKKVPQPVAK